MEDKVLKALQGLNELIMLELRRLTMPEQETATEKYIREQQKRRFELQLIDFIERNAPSDLCERARFEADLILLVRQIYTDAQQPFIEQQIRISSTAPIFYPDKG